jgi:membrane fusion protein, multidrug efflux system
MSDYSFNLQDATALQGRPRPDIKPASRKNRGFRPGLLAGGGFLLIAAGLGGALWHSGSSEAHIAAPPPPLVTVSTPLQQQVAPQTSFLGQFSAVESVELRAQVGGTLTDIAFTDGQIVHKGDLLFVIDPRPYAIKLAQAAAQVQSTQARLELATTELWRAKQLKRSDFASAQLVDQRQADQQAAQAALDQAHAAVRDAQLDLEYCRVTAPFTGRISAHRVSVGSLVSGSRAGSSPTTLLTTLVSLDPIHLDFDMSESDYLAYERAHRAPGADIDGTVDIALGDENHFDRHGTLDFVDNAVDRGSGTIHVRATVANPDLFIAPGEFARLRLAMATPQISLLLPDSAVTLDQSQHVVMTVAKDGTVVQKQVEGGAMYGGLRIIRAGLQPNDRVIIDGQLRAQPGGKVQAEPGQIHASTDQG